MSKYAEERYSPKVPACVKASISLRFDGASLGVRRGNSIVHSYPAVSGKPKQGEFDYSVDNQKRSFHGPIPEGEYWITFRELWKNAWYKPGSSEAWGNYRIAIHPYPNTNTYCRGGFFVHGGSVRGSAGCIDLTRHMSTFVKRVKVNLPVVDCYIPLTVKY